MGLASGLAPFSVITNSTEPLNKCIQVLSDGGASPIFNGRNASPWPKFMFLLKCSIRLLCRFPCSMLACKEFDVHVVFGTSAHCKSLSLPQLQPNLIKFLYLPCVLLSGITTYTAVACCSVMLSMEGCQFTPGRSECPLLSTSLPLSPP